MPPSPTALALLAATCLVVGLLVVGVRPRRRTGFLEISSRYRSFFRRLGVTDAAHFLALPGAAPHIVSGHPDRNVARITFGTDGEQWSAFLKREHRVGWRTRIGNALAGFGLSSRALREARTLQALQREGLPGPEWLAAGEDGQGRAFLLVRAAPGVELRAVLSAEKDQSKRQRLARRLGTALARLHTAGFRHPDLYANHVLVEGGKDAIRFLDWQRAYLRPRLSWRERRRDLAVLHATVDDALATTEERLICLRAYWRIAEPLGVSWKTVVQDVESQARRLLTRRHIREKRQPSVPPQAWICLAGEALCVTPVLQERYGQGIPEYLRPSRETAVAAPSLRRRWPVLPGAGRALLVQRNQMKLGTEIWPRRETVSPEQRHAALLLRLQRHGIAAPQVLALGQRRAADGRVESLLLTEPLADTCSLEAWLTCRMRRRTPSTGLARRWSVLRQTGALLRRLHEANCYLDFGPAGCGLAVRQADGQVSVVLDGVDSVTPRRRRQPRRAARDVQRVQRILRAAGCSRSDLYRFRAGYRQAEVSRRTAFAVAALTAGRSPLLPTSGLAALRRRRLARSHHECGRHRSLPRQTRPIDRPLDCAGSEQRASATASFGGVFEAALPVAALAGLVGDAVAVAELVAGLARRTASAMGAATRVARPPPSCRRRVHRSLGPAPQRSRRRGAVRHGVLAGGGPARCYSPRGLRVSAVEARSGCRDGAADAHAARPPLFSQGPVSVPLLH